MLIRVPSRWCSRDFQARSDARISTSMRHQSSTVSSIAGGGTQSPDITTEARTLANVIKAFDDYCLPRKNIAMEAFKFNMIVQKEKQSFSSFETELRTQLRYCDFECSSCHMSYANRMLRDRIIVGVQDKKLQLKLLDGKDDPLSKVVDACKVFEADCKLQ